MVRLIEVPTTWSEWLEVYGDPRGAEGRPDERWMRDNLISVLSPFPWRLSWDLDIVVNYLQVHRKVAESLLDALEEMWDVQGEDILTRDENRWGGCFNYRSKRGIEALSTHAFGAAMDINPHVAPFLAEGHQPQYIVDAFVKRGWTWGGSWERRDDMHLQAGRGI